MECSSFSTDFLNYVRLSASVPRRQQTRSWYVCLHGFLTAQAQERRGVYSNHRDRHHSLTAYTARLSGRDRVCRTRWHRSDKYQCMGPTNPCGSLSPRYLSCRIESLGVCGGGHAAGTHLYSVELDLSQDRQARHDLKRRGLLCLGKTAAVFSREGYLPSMSIKLSKSRGEHGKV
jgi:hypothetical protein